MPTNPQDKWYHVKPSEVEEMYKALKLLIESLDDDYELNPYDNLTPLEILTRAREVVAKIEIFYL